MQIYRQNQKYSVESSLARWPDLFPAQMTTAIIIMKARLINKCIFKITSEEQLT